MKLSPQPWRKVIRALGRDGWKAELICVPCHPKPIPVGTLREIIRQAGLTTEEFLALL